MKKIICLFIILNLLVSCTGKTAIGYNDTIIKPQLEIVSEMDTIFASPETSVEVINKNREEMVQIAGKSLEEIKKLEGFKGNSAFKNSAVRYFSFVKNYFSATENLDSIIYKFNSEKRIQSLSEAEYNETQQKFNEYLVLEQELLDEQQKFAKEFSIPLIK